MSKLPNRVTALMEMLAEEERDVQVRPSKSQRQAEHRNERRSEKQELKVEWGVS